MHEGADVVCPQQSDFPNSDVHPDTLNGERKKRNLAKYIVIQRTTGGAPRLLIDVDENVTRKDAIPDAIKAKGYSGTFEFFKAAGGMTIETVQQEKVW